MPENPHKDVQEPAQTPAKSGALVTAARYSEMGFVLPAAVFLGYILGRFFDSRFHTHWLYIAGIIFGAVAGFVQMIRMATGLMRGKHD